MTYSASNRVNSFGCCAATHVCRDVTRVNVLGSVSERTFVHAARRKTCKIISISIAATDLLDEERSPISTGEGMHHLMSRFTTVLLHYVKDLLHRAHIGSITEWPTHREW